MAGNAKLSRRESEIMEIIYRRTRATAAEVRADLVSPPGYSAVRATLRILEEKGHLKHEYDGPRYVFLPTVARSKASQSALQNIVATFFDGSPQRAVAALLGLESANLSEEELDSMAELIEQARKEGR
jgi:BlaI family penicillinase repressor